MSVFTNYDNFFSHPVDEGGQLLEDHLIAVAKKARDLILKTNLSCSQEAFYAGLLHDIGKLNPFYQDVFHTEWKKRKSVEDKTLKKYERMHSPFSAWAATKLLSEGILSEWSQNLVMCTIFYHHSALKNTLSKMDGGDRLKASQKGMFEYLSTFRKYVEGKDEFSKLDWDYCLSRFDKPISFDIEIKSNTENTTLDFLKSSCVFSALIQADRGSFAEWSVPEFKINLNTKNLIKQDSNLGQLRTEFQNHATMKHDVTQDVSILEAPTGIGKTKVFLDLIPKYVQENNLNRVFYFSPLLALTEDFENKLNQVINDEKNRILIYNHLFSGSLEGKIKTELGIAENLHWNFDVEAFNKEFVITTTQRLLMIIYSNKTSDKMKLLSLGNSLLIIDEVQTIAKFALPNLMKIFQEIARNLNSKILLVSATIPYELRELKTTSTPKEIREKYLNRTLKYIEFEEPLSIPSQIDGNVLFMSNTRKKTHHLYNSITNLGFNDVKYMSSGITKKARIDMLRKLDGEKSIVVSTQVLEAGVDVSFSQIFREMAPLDNIIQAMGRLNREAKSDTAKIVVFKSEKDDPIPYSELEWQESLKIIRDVSTSVELYNKLPVYYKTIFDKNAMNAAKTTTLDAHMKMLDFAEVWDFARNNILPDEHQESVFIPESESQWNQIKNILSSQEKSKKKEIKQFSNLTAQLPKSPDSLEISYMFDEELYEKGILLPKFQYLDKVYDKKVGLDIWTE